MEDMYPADNVLARRALSGTHGKALTILSNARK